jgi:prolyl 3-hydroxylase /prolyl 3,4-dihydroxylase
MDFFQRSSPTKFVRISKHRKHHSFQITALRSRKAHHGRWPNHHMSITSFINSQWRIRQDGAAEMNPVQELLEVFLPSPPFRRWLELVTDCQIESYDFLARRFRKGLDYALATSYEGEPKLEISLGLTPTSSWRADEEEEKVDGSGEDQEAAERSSTKIEKETEEENSEEEQEDVGGHEVYMADDDDSPNDDAAIHRASSDADGDNVLFTVPAN